MGLVWTEDFESGLGAWSIVGGAATGTTFFKSGANSLDLNCTGAGKYLSRTLPASTRTSVWGMWCYFDTDTSGSASLLQMNLGGGGFATMQLRTGDKLRVIATGANGTDSAAFADDAWHWISYRVISTGATWTLDYYVDGVSQSSVSSSGTAAQDQTSVFVGNTATNTYRRWVDDVSFYDNTADFPVAQPAGAPSSNDGLGMMGMIGAPRESDGLWVPQGKSKSGLYL